MSLSLSEAVIVPSTRRLLVGSCALLQSTETNPRVFVLFGAQRWNRVLSNPLARAIQQFLVHCLEIVFPFRWRLVQSNCTSFVHILRNLGVPGDSSRSSESDQRMLFLVAREKDVEASDGGPPPSDIDRQL